MFNFRIILVYSLKSQIQALNSIVFFFLWKETLLNKILARFNGKYQVLSVLFDI